VPDRVAPRRGTRPWACYAQQAGPSRQGPARDARPDPRGRGEFGPAAYAATHDATLPRPCQVAKNRLCAAPRVRSGRGL